MYSRENKSAKKAGNHSPSTAPNPFQSRSFGIQSKSEQSLTPQKDADAQGDRPNPYATNLLNIPIHQPVTELSSLHTGLIQRTEKTAPSGEGTIDVEELEDYLPMCVDNQDLNRKAYRRSNGITEGWNDSDLFYADGDGPLVQITVQMVNDYWDSRYGGFTKLSGPDWTKNCEDYAKGCAGFGASKGMYSNLEELKGLIKDDTRYVIKLGFHWMSVEKTGVQLTIRQKDAESAVYEKTFELENGFEYILQKYSGGGEVYATS